MAKQRKRRLKPYEAIPFTNELKQVINPGDSIIAVTHCTQHIDVNLGRYIGLRRHTNRWSNKDEYLTVVVEYDLVDEYDAHNVTGERWNWRYEPPGLVRVRYPYHPGYPPAPRSTIFTSQEERNRLMAEYSAKKAEIDAKYQAAKDDYTAKQKAWDAAVEEYKKANYTTVRKPYVKAKTLQRNRIYPINMQLKDLAKTT